MSFMSVRFGWAFAILALLAASETGAQAADVLACRSVADNAERLACYDKAVGGEAQAAQQDQKAAFGLPPAVHQSGEAGFGDPPPPPQSKAVEPAEPEEIDSITAKIVSMSTDQDRPILHLDNGQTWRFRDDWHGRLKPDGSNVATIERSLTGLGYVITVNDSAVKYSVVRLN